MPLPVPNPDVVARTLPDGAVLFHPGTEVYFGLNESGTLIWSVLGSAGADDESLIGALAARWPDVPRAQLEADALALLAELSARGLVTGDAS
jgi:hypothetical protein